MTILIVPLAVVYLSLPLLVRSRSLQANKVASDEVQRLSAQADILGQA